MSHISRSEANYMDMQQILQMIGLRYVLYIIHRRCNVGSSIYIPSELGEFGSDFSSDILRFMILLNKLMWEVLSNAKWVKKGFFA